MTYPDTFSIILLYILYISIAVQSKLPTDHFVKRKRNNGQNKENIKKNNKTIRTAKIALI